MLNANKLEDLEKFDQNNNMQPTAKYVSMKLILITI